MRKRFLAMLLAMLLICSAACAEVFDGYSYDVHYVEYDAASVSGWKVMRYADTSGVLLDMYSEESSVSVTLLPASDAPTLDALEAQHMGLFVDYLQLLGDPERGEWYAPWNDSEPGRTVRFSYSYADSDGSAPYRVVDYMARLDDEYFVLVELTDWSGSAENTAAWLEAGFLETFRIGCFEANGSMSVWLTAAEGSGDSVVLTLQPFVVEMQENQLDFDIIPDGEAVRVPVAKDCVILAPTLTGSEFGEEVALSADNIGDYMRSYLEARGVNSVFNVLLSNGEARWMTFSYLMQ